MPTKPLVFVSLVIFALVVLVSVRNVPDPVVSQGMVAVRRVPVACRAQESPSGLRPIFNRRSALKGVVFGGMSSILANQRAAKADGVDYKAVKADIEDLIRKDMNKGPTLVRLAWHSSGTYDKMSKTGGSGPGTIRFKEELAHGANAGLENPVKWLEPIYKKYGGDISYADLYTLSGVTAIEALGGPSVPWRAGRVDAMDPSAVTPDGRLPAADMGSPKDTAAHLRAIFGRMGFNDQEIVALAGAHALGRGHVDFSGYDGPWTFTPTRFNNAYYDLLYRLDWVPTTTSAGKEQYTDSKTKKLMMLPADLVMIQDPKFRKYSQLYAKDNAKFFADFTKAFQKLEELGTSNLQSVQF